MRINISTCRQACFYLKKGEFVFFANRHTQGVFYEKQGIVECKMKPKYGSGFSYIVGDYNTFEKVLKKLFSYDISIIAVPGIRFKGFKLNILDRIADFASFIKTRIARKQESSPKTDTYNTRKEGCRTNE